MYFEVESMQLESNSINKNHSFQFLVNSTSYAPVTNNYVFLSISYYQSIPTTVFEVSHYENTNLKKDNKHPGIIKILSYKY